MKVRGTFASSLKQLGQQHLQFIEQELTKRGLLILKRKARHTLKFTGGWDVQVGNQVLFLKISPTGTALTINRSGGNLFYTNPGICTFSDFDMLVKKLNITATQVIP